jgi:hypothetical protein
MSKRLRSVCFQIARQTLKLNTTLTPHSSGEFLFHTMVHESHLRVRINLHHNDFKLHRNDSTVYCYSSRMSPLLEIGHCKPIYVLSTEM